MCFRKKIQTKKAWKERVRDFETESKPAKSEVVEFKSKAQNWKIEYFLIWRCCQKNNQKVSEIFFFIYFKILQFVMNLFCMNLMQ